MAAVKPEVRVKELTGHLNAHADTQRASGQKRYLKSPYKFFGVRKTVIDQIARDFKAGHPDIDSGSLNELCDVLWRSEYHEQKSLAIALLKQHPERWDRTAVELVDRMIDEVTGWDHLDELAIHVLGPMITGKLVPIAYLDRCLVSANFWKRRAALIAQIKSLRRGKGDVQRHLEFCQKLMTEREFFIRKAIGWSLRELAKSEPRLVFDFLLKSKAEISGLSLREASKNLPAELKQYLV